MDTGELLTRWTVRIALALYLVSLDLRLCARGDRNRLNWARLAWTGGYAAFLTHLVAAFHFYHHWSHRAAYDVTARQTAEVVGLAFGGGVYINHLFALVWGADVCWWWCRPVQYLARSRAVEWTVQGFMAFIAFNATVVFGHGPIRWVGLVASVLLAFVAWRAMAAPARQIPEVDSL